MENKRVVEELRRVSKKGRVNLTVNANLFLKDDKAFLSGYRMNIITTWFPSPLNIERLRVETEGFDIRDIFWVFPHENVLGYFHYHPHGIYVTDNISEYKKIGGLLWLSPEKNLQK